jgi:hypothetical protein
MPTNETADTQDALRREYDKRRAASGSTEELTLFLLAAIIAEQGRQARIMAKLATACGYVIEGEELVKR